ncbi:hypothetical protein A9Q84_10195 [Halobacteriovorax marinus]|uniref:Lipoprotein n=1 Tax=Halobacteriovorax marinus TaxID=97084 RepID=A0A1Y5F7E5_9BACT|nr:hypothetical protein A9Q84_10195 [Halobacteriovorax marinus]
MKKLLLGLTLLTSVSCFATAETNPIFMMMGGCEEMVCLHVGTENEGWYVKSFTDLRLAKSNCEEAELTCVETLDTGYINIGVSLYEETRND